MDEITMFAELRPNDTLPTSTLADIRAELFPGLEPHPRAATASEERHEPDLLVLPIDTDERPRRSWGRTAGAAAAAVAALGLGGLWLVANRDAGESAPAAQPSTVTDPAVDAAGGTPEPDAQRTPSTTTPPTSATSLPLCTDVGCAGFDPLPVTAGAADFYVGPEELGDPTINSDLFGTLTRCVALSADLGSCDRIEGIAGVSLVSYPLDAAAGGTEPGSSNREIEIGTTFTELDPATYATLWGPSQADGPQTDTTVRGHPAIRYLDEAFPSVVWQERPGVLVWVSVPVERAADLMAIAEGVRSIAGPPTIPNRVVVTELAEPWDASDNNGDGLIVATSDGLECVGLDYVDTCGTDIEARSIVRMHSDGTTSVAGSVPAHVATVRIGVTGSEPIEIETIAFADSPSRFYSAVIPAGAVEQVIWLDDARTEVGRYSPAVAPPDASDGPGLYTTVDGDTLDSIARRFELPTELVAEYNGWTNIGPSDPLDPGTSVLIPSVQLPN